MDKEFDFTGIAVALLQNVPVWLLLSLVFTWFSKRREKEYREHHEIQVQRDAEIEKRLGNVEKERGEFLERLETKARLSAERHNEMINQITAIRISLNALQVIEIRESLELLKERGSETKTELARLNSELKSIWRHIDRKRNVSAESE